MQQQSLFERLKWSLQVAIAFFHGKTVIANVTIIGADVSLDAENQQLTIQSSEGMQTSLAVELDPNEPHEPHESRENDAVVHDADDDPHDLIPNVEGTKLRYRA